MLYKLVRVTSLQAFIDIKMYAINHCKYFTTNFIHYLGSNIYIKNIFLINYIILLVVINIDMLRIQFRSSWTNKSVPLNCTQLNTITI